MTLFVSSVVSYSKFIEYFFACGKKDQFSNYAMRVIYDYYSDVEEEIVIDVMNICDNWVEEPVNDFLNHYGEACDYFITDSNGKLDILDLKALCLLREKYNVYGVYDGKIVHCKLT